jgi:hypothetical protein
MLMTDTDTSTNTYLALYTGPNGPISSVFTADSLEDAKELIQERGESRGDDAEDALDLPFHADEAKIDEALLAGQWDLVEPARANDEYAIYRLTEGGPR